MWAVRVADRGGPMSNLGLRIKRGVNLAVRDRFRRTSDPYVVVMMGKKKLQTHVVKNNVNPEWNQDFTLSTADPNVPIILTVYDHDLCSQNDRMGDAEIDIKEYIEDLKVKLDGRSTGTIQPRKAVKDLDLKLRNVECGELQVQLQWTV